MRGGWCSGSLTALDTYKMYGKATNCAGGKGGAWANDVYKISNGGVTPINGCDCSDHLEDNHLGKIIENIHPHKLNFKLKYLFLNV